MYLLYLEQVHLRIRKRVRKGVGLFPSNFAHLPILVVLTIMENFFFVKLTGFRDTAAPVLGVTAAGGFAKITLLLITFEDFIMRG